VKLFLGYNPKSDIPYSCGRDKDFITGDEKMLLKSFRLEIFNNKCMPGAETVNCFAHLDQNVSVVLPYLNSMLGGFAYVQEPPSVTFKVHGKLITVHGCRIAVNALKDEAEARKIVDWLKREINETWENRDSIVPSTKGATRPKIIEILKLLPKTNCRACGEPTCMVFATRLAEGVKANGDCPTMEADNRTLLEQYLSRFHFDV
jgi:ArsR family metal-binding transcriptional regulator